MSKLAKLQEEKLEKLKMLSSAGRVQLEDALSPESASISPPAPDILPKSEAGVLETQEGIERAEPLVQKKFEIGCSWEAPRETPLLRLK